MEKDMIQDCQEANQGFGTDPKKNCQRCDQHGFYYEDNWAKTCVCKSI